MPCRTSRETVKRSDLAGHTGHKYCASYSRYYWGLKLCLVCAGDGMPIMWCLAHPKIGESEVVAALLEHDQHVIRDGQVMLAGKGFSGNDFAATTAAHGLVLLRPDRKDETYRNGNLGGVRHWIESVNQTRKGQLDLEQHGRRTERTERVGTVLGTVGVAGAAPVSPRIRNLRQRGWRSIHRPDRGADTGLEQQRRRA